MNTLTTVLAVFAALNPFRAACLLAQPTHLVRKSFSLSKDSSPEKTVLIGAGAALMAVAVLVALGDPVASALEVSAPTLRLGMAIVVVLGGAASVLGLGLGPRTSSAETGEQHRRVPAWLSPVLVPVLLTVELVAASLAAGARGFKPAAVVGAAISLVVFLLLAQRSRAGGVSTAEGGRLLRSLQSVTGAVAMVVGVAIAVTAVQTV